LSFISFDVCCEKPFYQIFALDGRSRSKPQGAISGWWISASHSIIIEAWISFCCGGNDMSLGDTVDSLKSKHHALEEAIEQESNRPHPDDIEVASLKKQKLRIKDEIAALKVE
jgi:hypothetical protein